MADFKIDPDYKEVAERLADLFAKHPEGSVRGSYEFVDIGGWRVVYRAECFRTPDDLAPGIGTAWEEVPGKTPYTRGSEIQNAETSAWGRAIVAAGASTSKRIASADEIRLANDRREGPTLPVHIPASEERVEKCKALVLEKDLAEWVKRQEYRWPWSDEACKFIELYAANQPGPNADKPLPSAEPMMTREESKANEAAKAEPAPTHCPECGAAPLEAHAEGCTLSPF